ncbi:hypothetical protein M9Y10_043682 [Tritrichomonas musculus]|uniref:eRF1 domain-containing protein n=1 Tax=Tritrichomonas musculus TaxID=1915356 RepID=A0ABR2K1E5_9EUKA
MVIEKSEYYDYYDYYEWYFRIRIEYDEEVLKIYRIIGIGDLFRFNNSDRNNYSVIEEIRIIENGSNDKYKFNIININVNDKGNRKSLFIGVNDSFELITRDYTKIDSIYNIDKRYEEYKIYRESVSDVYIQNESFRILKEYMNKKMDKVIYGYDVISNIENVKVVFVSWSFVKNLKKEWFKLFTNKDNKIKNANIVVFSKGNKNYEELKMYGGIIGVIY